MNSSQIDIDGHPIFTVEVALPGAPLVVAYTKNGFVMCGYLDIETANKLNVAAALVRGVKTVDDLLKAEVKAVSKVALEKGVQLGVSGKQALAQFL